MKFFRCYLRTAFVLGILVLLAGCSSPLRQAEKLALSGQPEAAISAYEQVMKEKPGSAEAQQAHLGIAETYYKRIEDHQKGLEVYEAVAKAYPKTKSSGKANYAIAWHYFNAEDYAKAREKFALVTQEISGTEEADGAALAIAACYEKLKEYEKAAELYKDFSKVHPTHSRAAQAGLSAAKIYETELDKSDEAAESYKYVASKYSLSSSGREARTALDDMGVDVSDLADASAAETQQAQTQTTAPTGVRGRRRARNVPRADIGSRQRTEEQQSRSISKDFGIDPMDIMPSISGDSQGTMYDAFYMFANMELQSGNHKEAGALYEKALQLAPTSWNNAARAYFCLGKCYKGIGMPDKAAEMFKAAIKRDRKVIDSMIVTGETHYSDEEYPEAIVAYKTALGLVSHKDSEIYYKIGLAYEKLKDTDNALEAFERSVALKPTARDTDSIAHLAYIHSRKDAVRAELYDKEARGKGNVDYRVQKEIGSLCYKYAYIFAKEEDRAKQSSSCFSWAKIRYNNSLRVLKRKITDDLKKAMESDSADITVKLISEKAASGDQAASDALKKIASLLADFRLMNSRIAISQIKAKQLTQAQETLDKLKEYDPNASDSAEVHYALGELALAQGDKDASLAEIKKALEIDPEHKEAAERLNVPAPQETSESQTSG